MLLPETHRHADHGRFDYRYGFFLPWKDAMVPVLESQGADVRCLSRSNSLSILLSARHVARELSAWGAEVLHCHLPIAGVVGRIAGRLAEVPVVYTEHNVLERYHPLTRWANLLTWRYQEAVVAVSEDVAESLRRSAPGHVPVRTVLNGVDLDRFDGHRERGREVRERLGIPREGPVIGTVAVFRSQKRLDEWLRVARTLCDRHPDLHFLLVGDGPLRSELEAEAGALGLGSVVHWTGLQEDVRPYLAVMDVYMMSSAFEGLPVALLEAMAMRCAVASTAVGGIPEVLRDGENGLLVAVDRPHDLVDRATDLVADPELRGRLGAAARGTVEEGFSVKRMARELEDIYLEVVQGYRNAG
ncbi:MAG: glycosyltransferase [Gemmatimonadota bacterium]